MKRTYVIINSIKDKDNMDSEQAGAETPMENNNPQPEDTQNTEPDKKGKKQDLGQVVQEIQQ